MYTRTIVHIAGEVSEWFKESVLKTVVSVRVPWVRIPPSPLFWDMLVSWFWGKTGNRYGGTAQGYTKRTHLLATVYIHGNNGG